MSEDERVVISGEDVEMLRRNLLVRFGTSRVRNAPISESAFRGAAVGAAMAGLRPVVEIMLAGIPGLAVVVPSNPADAAGLMLSAIADNGPVVYLEHKLLSDYWLDYLGAGNRRTVSYDVPRDGAHGLVHTPPTPVPIGVAASLRSGSDVALVSLGVGVHRCVEAATTLADRGIQSAVLDLRSASPLDREAVLELAHLTGHVVAVDEDYISGGLSGEIAAALAANGTGARFARVALTETLPYSRAQEDRALPNVQRIITAVERLLSTGEPTVLSSASARINQHVATAPHVRA